VEKETGSHTVATCIREAKFVFYSDPLGVGRVQQCMSMGVAHCGRQSPIGGRPEWGHEKCIPRHQKPVRKFLSTPAFASVHTQTHTHTHAYLYMHSTSAY